MRSSSRLALCVLLAVAVHSQSPDVRADEDDSKAFFAQGRKLRLDSNCKDAVTSFRRALELWPQGLGALRNIAECEEQLGQFASARNSYWDLRRAVLQSNEPNYDGWEKYAEERYNRLAAKVGKITVLMSGEGVSAARVAIDGKPLDPRLVGIALERDLGPHVIQVFYGGATPLSEQRTLAAGGDIVVRFELPGVPGGAATATAATATAGGSAAPASFPFKPAAIVSFAAGAASLVAMGVFIGIRADALATIDATCPAHQGCPGSLRGAQDRGALASTLVNVFAVAGAVGVGAGAAIVVSASLTSSERAAELRWVPVERGGVLVARGRF